MKKFLGFLLISVILLFTFSSHVYALGYSNTAADLVIGQDGFSCKAGENRADNWRGMDLPCSSAYVVNGKLIVPGCNSLHIAIFNSIPTSNYPRPDVILGRSDPCVHPFYPETPNDYKYPVNVFFDGVHFFVADAGNHRVLIYNHGIPTSHSTAPDVVVGQPDFTSRTANLGGRSARTLYNPEDVWSDGTKLLILDRYNSRILIYNTIPTENNAAADIVIGQPDMVTGTAGITAAKYNQPRGFDIYEGKLYVADQLNSRVLVYNSIPTVNGASADLVLGQPNMTSNTANNGGLAANTLNNPSEVSLSYGKLFIADRLNHRILIWNAIPTTNFAPADVVVGQSDFISNSSGVSASKFNEPHSGYSDGTKLYVTDYRNHRMLIFNSIPTQNGVAADVVVGQPDMTSNVRFGGQISAGGLAWPSGLSSNGTSLFVADYLNYRVLKYDTLPTQNGALADVVLGQASFSTAISGTSASQFGYVYQVLAAGDKLLVGGGSRVLVYNSIPTENGAAADVVIGQPDMTSNTANNGGLSAKSLNSVLGLESYEGKLFVADGNNRILVYNSVPASNFKSADIVIGQPDFVHNTANNGGIGAGTINTPQDIKVCDGKLIVADSGNNRVLIFNSVPTSNGVTANVVIGQPNMTSNVANNGGLSAHTLNVPRGIACDRGRLFIGDMSNSRVLVYNTIPTTNGADADVVIGQSDMTSVRNGVSASNLQDPRGITVVGNKLFVTDVHNSRILQYALGPTNISVTGVGVTNTPNLSVTLQSVNAKEMMISQISDFSGATWEVFATTKQIALSGGDGTKTYYVKMRDYANYESSTFTVSTVLDTTKPNTVKITDIGEITNIPDKSPLYYYFTSQFAQIRGTAEASSTVHFKYGSKDFTATAGSDGKFLITVTGLPRELVEFSYYAQDLAGNKNASRILKLMIGEENFPAYLVSSATEPAVTPTGTGVPSDTPTQTPTPTLILYDVQLTDQQGHILINTTVYISGQKYQTDGDGKLYVQESVAKSAGVTVEVNGKKYQGNILGNTIVAQLTQVTTAKKANYYWLLWLILISAILISYYAYRKRNAK